MVCLWRGSRDANGGRHSHLGKGAQRALRQAVRRSCAVAWSGTGRGIGGHTYAESGRVPATIFSLSLPPCFPGFAEPGGEARNGPGGPSEAIDFIDEIWSGRRDSNPRPQPWQGCALPLSYTRVLKGGAAAGRAYDAMITRMHHPPARPDSGASQEPRTRG